MQNNSRATLRSKIEKLANGKKKNKQTRKKTITVHRVVARKEAVSHTYIYITLNSAEARGQYCFTSG